MRLSSPWFWTNSSNPAHSSNPMARKRALVIGNSQYQDPRFNQLVMPGQDAAQLADVLRLPDICGFDEVNALIDNSEGTLRRRISRFFSKSQRDELLLLYFSGHGVLDEQGLLYFAAKDTELEALRATSIPAHFVRQEMDLSFSRRIVLILDCCYSGAFTRTKSSLGQSVGTAVAFDVKGYGHVVLTATDATQYAWEEEQVAGKATASVFTHYLVQGLRTGSADLDGDGSITIDELYEYTHEHVVRSSPRQTPLKIAEKQQGRLVIAQVSKAYVEPEVAAKESLVEEVEPPRRAGQLHPEQSASGPAEADQYTVDTSRIGAEVSFALDLEGSSTHTYQLPKVEDIFNEHPGYLGNDLFDRQTAAIIERTLASFGAPATIVEVNRGPTFTEFGVEPSYINKRNGRVRVRISDLTALDHELALTLGVKGVVMEAPVPGKGYVGIAIRNSKRELVTIREVIEADAYHFLKSRLRLAIGLDLRGEPVVLSLDSIRHLLIAGSNGAGKTSCVHTALASLLLQNAPTEMRLVLIDPRKVDLGIFAGIPHLAAQVIGEPSHIVVTLKSLVSEMERRYRLFSGLGARVRNIRDYNASVATGTLPDIVLAIEDLVEVVTADPGAIEHSIQNLAYLGHPVGIHVIATTQHPTSHSLQRLLKTYFPTRIALQTMNSSESRAILGQDGAEGLFGHGDLLLQAFNAPGLLRAQGCQLSDHELTRLIDFWRAQNESWHPQPSSKVLVPSQMDTHTMYDDELTDQAIAEVRRIGAASTSLLQRRLQIGYERASRLMATLEKEGIIGPSTGTSKPRVVLAPDVSSNSQ
jgi:DNA segregation ATPase FtsK/SpoIIIE-like protein